MSTYFRDVFDEVGLVSGFVQRIWVSVGTCSARSVSVGTFGEVVLVSGLVRRGR